MLGGAWELLPWSRRRSNHEASSLDVGFLNIEDRASDLAHFNLPTAPTAVTTAAP